MKDVAIRPLTQQDTEAAARFISLDNTGEAAALPDLPTARAEAAHLLRRVLERELPAFTLRLYEGTGRICGLIALSPDDPSVLLGPLLHIGDWAGHADAMLTALRNALTSGRNTMVSENGMLSVRFYPGNRNMHSLVERHGGETTRTGALIHATIPDIH